MKKEKNDSNGNSSTTIDHWNVTRLNYDSTIHKRKHFNSNLWIVFIIFLVFSALWFINSENYLLLSIINTSPKSIHFYSWNGTPQVDLVSKSIIQSFLFCCWIQLSRKYIPGETRIFEDEFHLSFIVSSHNKKMSKKKHSWACSNVSHESMI